MRITNSMMANRFLSDANVNLNKVSKYQEQVDSSKRITRISDDPQATITALKARNRLSNLALYQGNISTANSYLSEAESAAGELDEILQSAYEELVSAQSGAKSQEELDLIAEDIDNLKGEVLSIGNTSIGTTYIFGGYNATGSTDGITKTAPFTTDETTGDLIYNGINLSQFAWKDEFIANTDAMSESASKVLAYSADLSASLTDENSRNISLKAQDAASGILEKGQAALNAAEEFGASTASPDYIALSSFLVDFSSLNETLGNECSKALAGDYILESDPGISTTADGEIDYAYYEENGISVMTDDEYANCYSSVDCKTILANMTALLEEQYDGFGNPIGSQMDQVVAQLSGAVTIPADVQDALDAESGKQIELQVGVTQTVDLSFTGLDIMGSGKDNIYHILDKCAGILRGDSDSGDLSEMIATLQDKQSGVLNFQTKIGATQNRLNLIGSRYDTSEINYSEMKSEAEDADMAEAIINFTTAQTVYSAALAAGSELIQTSLIDFLM